MTAPQWSPIDDDTADLLAVLADPTPIHGTAADEWAEYVAALEFVATGNDGRIPANALRPLVRGVVKPSRIGAFARRARLEGLIEDAGWDITEGDESGNNGRPCRDFVWRGGAL